MWNLNLIYSGDDDPKIQEDAKKMLALADSFVNKWKRDSNYLSDPDTLSEALSDLEGFERQYGEGGPEAFYFFLKSELDKDNPEIKARLAKVRERAVKIDNDMQFFEMALSKVSPEQQKIFLSAEKLLPYRHYLEQLFASARFLLSEEEERILSLVGAPAYSNWVSMTSSFLAKETCEIDGKELSFSEILPLMDSLDQKTRDSAARQFNKIMQKHVSVAEWEMNSILEEKKVNDELRNMDRPDLGRHISDDIDSSVVDCMTSVVSASDISRRFYRLKAKLLGKKKLKYHERNVSLGDRRKFTYGEAVSSVKAILSDPELLAIFEGLEGGHIDAFPNKGKEHGAFCASHSITLPTYILLNFTGRLDDVLTLAHESGHAINAELVKKAQNSLSSHDPLSTAEVASTFFETLVLNSLIAKSRGKEKLFLLMKRLDMDIASIFRQVACYRFEQELHMSFRAKGYLSKDEIGALFQRHMRSYMGDYVLHGKGSENWWVYWGHIRHFFYVYSYASGIMIAKSLAGTYAEDRSFLKKVKVFLSAGSSRSPRQIFSEMGIDIADKGFWEKGLEEIGRDLDEAERLA